MNLSMLSISTAGIVFSVLGGIVLLSAILFMIIVPFKAWVVAIFAGAYVPSYKLLAIRARKIDVMMLVEAYIQSKKVVLDFLLLNLKATIFQAEIARHFCQLYTKQRTLI